MPLKKIVKVNVCALHRTLVAYIKIHNDYVVGSNCFFFFLFFSFFVCHFLPLSTFSTSQFFILSFSVFDFDLWLLYLLGFVDPVQGVVLCMVVGHDVCTHSHFSGALALLSMKTVPYNAIHKGMFDVLEAVRKRVMTMI